PGCARPPAGRRRSPSSRPCATCSTTGASAPGSGRPAPSVPPPKPGAKTRERALGQPAITIEGVSSPRAPAGGGPLTHEVTTAGRRAPARPRVAGVGVAGPAGGVDRLRPAAPRRRASHDRRGRVFGGGDHLGLRHGRPRVRLARRAGLRGLL